MCQPTTVYSLYFYQLKFINVGIFFKYNFQKTVFEKLFQFSHVHSFRFYIEVNTLSFFASKGFEVYNMMSFNISQKRNIFSIQEEVRSSLCKKDLKYCLLENWDHSNMELSLNK